MLQGVNERLQGVMNELWRTAIVVWIVVSERPRTKNTGHCHDCLVPLNPILKPSMVPHHKPGHDEKDESNPDPDGGSLVFQPFNKMKKRSQQFQAREYDQKDRK